MKRTTREARTASTMLTAPPLHSSPQVIRASQLILAGGISFLTALGTTALLSPSRAVLYGLIAALYTTLGMMLAGLRLLYLNGKRQP